MLSLLPTLAVPPASLRGHRGGDEGDNIKPRACQTPNITGKHPWSLANPRGNLLLARAGHRQAPRRHPWVPTERGQQHPWARGRHGGVRGCGARGRGGGGRPGRDFFLRAKVGGVRGCQLAMGSISTDKALPCRCEEFQLNIQPICLCVGEGLLCRRKASRSAP